MNIEIIPKNIYIPAYKIVDVLRQNGFTALWVGGAVRDVVMNRVPKEIDIATNAKPEEIAKLFDNVYMVGAKFGVCVVVMDSYNFEVSTFRKDLDYYDGRHPESVVYTTAQGDVNRRDFIINTLFYDPIEEKMIDYLGAVNDIKNKIIRTVGDAKLRFEEDRLRILRAIRFYAELGFE